MEKRRHMTQLIDALSARTRFGELMDETDKEQKRFLVSRKGKPMVVILGVEDYLKNIVGQNELLTRIQTGASELGLDKMSDDEIDFEIQAVRHKE